MNVGIENGKQMWGLQMESGCRRGNRQMDRGSQRVGEYQCDFFYYSWVQVFENKNFKESSEYGSFIFRRFKESPGSGFKESKEGQL
jgi:hypothetical protein